MKQNITLSLDKELIQKAKVLAAHRNTSVTGLLAGELTRLVQQAEHSDQFMRNAMEYLSKGFELGGRTFQREALHDRQGLR